MYNNRFGSPTQGGDSGGGGSSTPFLIPEHTEASRDALTNVPEGTLINLIKGTTVPHDDPISLPVGATKFTIYNSHLSVVDPDIMFMKSSDNAHQYNAIIHGPSLMAIAGGAVTNDGGATYEHIATEFTAQMYNEIRSGNITDSVTYEIVNRAIVITYGAFSWVTEDTVLTGDLTFGRADVMLPSSTQEYYPIGGIEAWDAQGNLMYSHRISDTYYKAQTYVNGAWEDVDGLSEVDEQTLKYFKFDPISNEIKATRTITTEPATVKVGNHSLSSGGENFVFTNRTTDIDWMPAWQGIKPQHIQANTDETGIITPSFRHYTTDVLETELDGAPHASQRVDYNVQSTVGVNNSVFAQDIKCSEVIAPDDWLFYYVRVGGANAPIVYQQIITGQTLASGDIFHWDFDHPLEGRAETVVTSQMWIAKGDQDAPKKLLRVYASSDDDTRRYVKVYYRLFVDSDVSSGITPINAVTDPLLNTHKVRYPSSYAVDTTSGAVTMPVNANTSFNSFEVFDSNQSFSNSNPCTVQFPAPHGNAVLQTKNDHFLFYKDGSTWKYLDMATKDGGVV